MRRFRIPCLVLACLAIPALPMRASRAAEVPPGMQERITAARDRVYPALVMISVVSTTEDGGRQKRLRGIGSGTILDEKGTVLTNHHVAGHGTRLVCTLSNKEEVPADLVGTDAMTDLSVLRLRLAERKDPKAPLSTAALGDSDALQVGDYVLAMGSPQGLSRTVTLGIISNKERTFTNLDLEGEPSGTLTRWIQHDALILPGNSGGPLVDLKGEVVGINELGGTGMGFAIPSNLARTVLAEILDKGRVHRAWLGVSPQTLLKGSGGERGVLVGSVEPDSPAAAAGLEPGDILLNFDGTEMTARFEDELPLFHRRVAEAPAGKQVEIAFLRGGETKTVQVTLGEDEPMRPKEKELRRLGITASDLSRPLARALRLSDPSGAFITGVRAGGGAGSAKPPLQGGDILRGIDGRDVKRLQDLLDWLESVKPEEKRTAVADVERQGARVLSVVVVEPKQDDPSGRQVAKAWLGCATQVLLRPLAEAVGLAGMKGVRVTQVHADTPAAEAGLQVGDVITHLGEREVNASREGDGELFNEMVRRCRIGEQTALKIVRAGQPMDLQVTLGSSPVEPKDATRTRDADFEFVARDICFDDRVGRRWDRSVTGCMVESVEQSGWAGFSGLWPGDLILSIAAKPIGSVEDFKKAMADVKAAKPATVVIMIRRGLQTGFLSVEPLWER